jgi:lipoyl(octanoyl) transferase
MRTSWLGRIGYRAAWDLQEAARERILAGDEDAEELLLLEHDPVITLGRSADRANLLDASGIEVVETSRGGDVTAHGPGQLVIYPVVRLRKGIVAHVEGIGRAIVAELGSLGVASEWRRDPAGVWIGAAKIAACGVHVRRRVAIHGFALNVTDEPLALFRRIVPCGLSTPVTTIAAHVATPPALESIAHTLAPRIVRALAHEK